LGVAHKIRRLLESVAKPGTFGLTGRKLEQQCAADLSAYFKQLGKRIIALELEKLYTQQVEHALHSVDMRLQNALRIESPTLRAVLHVNMQAAYLASDRQPVQGFDDLVQQQRAKNNISEASNKAPKKSQQVDVLGPSGEAAAEYASKKSAELVTKINDTTRESLRGVIRYGIENQLGVSGLSNLIRDDVLEMARSRADMIAATEMNGAMAEAALRKMQKLGYEYKQIVLSDDACEICQENADQDPLPVDELYTSGDERPPFHPNCRCAIVAARAPEES
jgi:hypothetical protein